MMERMLLPFTDSSEITPVKPTMSRQRKKELRALLIEVYTQTQEMIANVRMDPCHASDSKNDVMPLPGFLVQARKLLEALARVNVGNYGYCGNGNCNKEIPVAILKGLPFKRRCLSCDYDERIVYLFNQRERREHEGLTKLFRSS